MADLKPGVAPVTDVEPGSQQDELEAIEQKHDAKAQAEEGGDTKAAEGEGAAGDDDASVAKLQSFMVKKGIKSLDELVDLTSDLESKNTKLSQDVQRLSAIPTPAFVPTGVPGTAMAPASEELDLPANLIDLVTSKETLAKFVKGIEDRTVHRLQRVKETEDMTSIAAEVAAKRAENPVEFDELRPIMLELTYKNPKSKLPEIYEAAKKTRDAREAALAERIQARLGLSAQDRERLKGITNRLRTAPVTSGSGKQVDPIIAERDKADKELLSAIANADKY